MTELKEVKKYGKCRSLRLPYNYVVLLRNGKKFRLKRYTRFTNLYLRTFVTLVDSP